ncbi:MAG TPA: TonB-dependent receptor, partial [Ohtaekwangia sp.]|uniref:TonB-dependent receptor n=1 Tax=Ohtaekwangia sp. TaxID=2066019 RepID=UPI002F928B7D
MKKIYIRIVFAILTLACPAYAQQVVHGKILDSQTKEPLIGATVSIPGTGIGAVTDIHGAFQLTTSSTDILLEVSYIGYDKQTVTFTGSEALVIALQPSVNNLQQVVITANREAALRTDAPVAISKISSVMINDAKPVLLNELINKVPGVVMLNYNNEQHAMAIRQPMGTSAYFLYMEDGIPIRPMGVFNHNALIEMNVMSISTVEVVKGPASSLYGPEAVGGAINFITRRPTALPTASVGIQVDQWGYKRIQYGAGGMITKKLGIYIGGFQAKQRDSWQTYSDYDKSSINARLDYALTAKTNFTLAFSGNEYNSDMSGSVDSIAFYNREYTSTTDFTYRKVHSQRTRFTVTHQWNASHETMLTLFYRDNYIEQNPNYSIRWTSGSTSATGEVNRNSFYSKGAILQHSIKLPFLQSRILAGGSIDYSPTNYWSYQTELGAQLRPDGKSVEKYTLLKEDKDVFLSKYQANLVNSAIYSQVEMNPVERLKVTVGARYDRMSFDYQNYLDATSGNKAYERVTPKIGATYDLGNGKGLYVNYSQGFSPPGLTSVFRKKPTADPAAPTEFYYNLEPARFDNIELGGWASLFENKVYIDAAVYQMNGHKELLSIRQPDNSYDYQSAGKTLHRGVEYSLTYKPDDQWFIRFGGTNAIHRFEDFALSTRSSDQVKNVNGNDMPQAPHWIANSEVTYKPKYIKGLRIAVEW